MHVKVLCIYCSPVCAQVCTGIYVCMDVRPECMYVPACMTYMPVYVCAFTHVYVCVYICMHVCLEGNEICLWMYVLPVFTCLCFNVLYACNMIGMYRHAYTHTIVTA
jgi:hypothetical protein